MTAGLLLQRACANLVARGGSLKTKSSSRSRAMARSAGGSMHPMRLLQTARSAKSDLELTSRVIDRQGRGGEASPGAGPSCESTSGVDVALATNMISVGLDIIRLGLMVVQGQPKTAAEYIQATSRVGRDPYKPGLVLAVLNVHKPRDRIALRTVPAVPCAASIGREATSVTPWAARALDRALAAVVVSLARHLSPNMTPHGAVARLKQHPELREEVKQAIVSTGASRGYRGWSRPRWPRQSIS